MNVIDQNPWRPVWQALGTQFGDAPGARWPQPRLILCISAHWLTDGWWLTAMAQPPTIHDFGGFPRELFEQQYPAPGAPELALEISQLIRQPDGSALGLDDHQWGLDHGCWGVLKPMFPQASIPVIQLSMDYSQAPAVHLALGEQLRGLRERGVLVLASGNVVHNLRAMQRDAPDNHAYDWTIEFDRKTEELLNQGDHLALANFRQWGRLADLAHPTWEHFLPLLYAAGAATPGAKPEYLNVGFQTGSVSMRSVVWS
jgi:4,5-DOPA dioxygenase extradiol